MSQKDDLITLITENQRRLQKLQEKKAQLGIGTPAEVLTEIEDIEADLDRLKGKLAGLDRAAETAEAGSEKIKEIPPIERKSAMTDKDKDDKSYGVSIGKVTGSFSGNVIAGRDINARDIVTGSQVKGSPEKEPTVAELKQLLADLQHGLAELAAQQEALKAVSAGAPGIAQAVADEVKAAAAQIKPELKPDDAKSVQESLEQATGFLTTLLDGAKKVARKAGEVGQAVQPLAAKLEPLVEQLGRAAVWVARLWLTG